MYKMLFTPEELAKILPPGKGVRQHAALNVGIDPSALSNILNGRTGNPTVKTLEALTAYVWKHKPSEARQLANSSLA
jgi:transcriptional regulator with XRE-family HTH domain